VNAGTLGNWVGQERIECGERDGLTVDERSDLVELRAENAQLRMVRDLLRRSLAF
jgi:transposase